MWLSLAVLLSVTLVQGQLTECPGGWEEWSPIGGPSACYRCFTNEEEWEKANNICKQYNGFLASIHSRVENDKIIDICPDSYDLWIGYNDKDVEGNWEWSDGSGVSYENWDSGEPDGKSRGIGIGDNMIRCAAQRNEGLLPPGRGWEDEECTSKKKFTCKVMLN